MLASISAISMPVDRSVLIARPVRRRDCPVGQGLQYVDAARRHAHPEHQMIFPCRTMTTLRKLPTTAPPSSSRMTGMRMAQTRGGKRDWIACESSTKGCVGC